ncbi:multicopper oxidase domain-containing protein [Thalassotalea sp. ND16A]|uniref:multicopper oxidase domain-containing protein n=1 Tax=Thalassotalea sp. ND16A TaxID=1535422 RepID=UPI0006899B48|nr:multicopper oxidase domain-containing protein [Thalassotalea sp. ND16A]
MQSATLSGRSRIGHGIFLAFWVLLAIHPGQALGEDEIVIQSVGNSPVDATNSVLSAGERGGFRGALCDVPTDAAPSPLFDAQSFSQQMLRFEEFGSRKIEEPCPTGDCPLTLPSPVNAYSTVGGAALDNFLNQRIHPFPSEQRNNNVLNPWQTAIESMHTGSLLPLTPGALTSYGDGRPPGPQYGHQRWQEFFPQVYVETAIAGARYSLGARDQYQKHQYSYGEFGKGPDGESGTSDDGLYHNTVGQPGFEGTTAGIPIRFHPNMPLQDPQSLWTFDGTLPPKLLMARYGEPILFRNYNALPIKFEANRGFGNHFITTHEHNGHTPAESDGYANAFFLPGQFYDYHWPVILAGQDSINTDATDKRASSPCIPGETMVISKPGATPPTSFTKTTVTCPAEGRINIPGDWRETMSTHWFHDHMLDYTAQNVYKGNAAMMNYYSALDRGNECVDDGVNLRFPSGCAMGPHSWGNRDYDVNLEIAGKAWGQDTAAYTGTAVSDTRGQLWFATFEDDGFLGDRMTVNWLYDPYLNVRARSYRFRVLNAHVSRFLRLALVVERTDGNGEFAGETENVSYDRVGFHMIANDGNIMEHAIPFDGSLDLDADGKTLDHFGILPTQSIAERYDIIVDFSQFTPDVAGNISQFGAEPRLYLVNLLEHENGKKPEAVVSLAEILAGDYDDCDTIVGKLLEFRVKPYSGTDLSMNPADYVPGKKKMIPLPEISEQELASAHHRTFVFGRGAATDLEPVTITQASFTDSPAPSQAGTNFPFEVNGEGVNHTEFKQLPEHADKPWGIATDGSDITLPMDARRLTAAPKLGDFEIWHLQNGGGGWSHNVHIHFEEGRILTRDGKAPPEWDKWARKDVYRIGPMDDSGDEVTLAIRFREFAGTFMEHCHNTQHEDHAMLMRWDIENPGQLKAFLTPEPQWNGVTYTESYELPTASAVRATQVGDVEAAENFLQDHEASELLCPPGATTACPGAPDGVILELTFTGTVDESGRIRIMGEIGAGNQASSPGLQCRTDSDGEFRCRGRGLTPGDTYTVTASAPEPEPESEPEPEPVANTGTVDERGRIDIKGNVGAGNQASATDLRCITEANGDFRCRGRGLTPGDVIPVTGI